MRTSMQTSGHMWATTTSWRIEFHPMRRAEGVMWGTRVYDTAWDPGGWGQTLGGTYLMMRAPSFIDLVHITGKSIVKSACRVEMKCSCFQQGKDMPPPDYSGQSARIVGDTLPESSPSRTMLSRAHGQLMRACCCIE